MLSPRDREHAYLAAVRYGRGILWILVAILLVVLVIPAYAARPPSQDAVAEIEAYAHAVAHEAGLPSVRVVFEDFADPRQLGESGLGLTEDQELVYAVFLSTRYARNGLTVKLRNTIRHEVCHLQQHARLGVPSLNGRFHHAGWKRCAKRLGVGYDGVVLD